ncbi:MAG: imidazoleglycerol-phosphate dehydratase HisB [Oscillospiraceae bacterium]|jgi:imidazoleglycerol-phosphate dehydratase|nr:imidazoleglycerol-phosphate dehydratase HisB [Oscillospiraceae bacterium]
MRTGEVTRSTTETKVKLSLNLDGVGNSAIDTGVGFFDHMLELFARHGRFDLDVSCKGDTHIDNHHSVEDIGICLGTAFLQALGDARGIFRYSDVTLPMDEALVLCAVDVSGRGHLSLDITLPDRAVGTMDTELLEEFLQAFVRKAGLTVHIRMLDGKNTHHILEACFKALARALRNAVKIDNDFRDDIPSTKGRIV